MDHIDRRNGEAGPVDRLRKGITSPPNLKLAIQSALELLGAGDQRGAELVLLDVLDEAVQPIGGSMNRCVCGRVFDWPGELEAHQFRCVQAQGLETAA